MRCGLFGKLGSKRDFIALATPRKFREVREPWREAGRSASRHPLGDKLAKRVSRHNWFGALWLGAEICGTSVAGAIMPSLDAIGRYYPLTLHAIADQATSIALPDTDAQDSWYEEAERFLMATLDPAANFDATVAALEQIRPAALQPEMATDFAGTGDLVGTMPGDDGFAVSLATLRSANPGIYAAGTFWWTAGGTGFASMALSCRGLPDPYHYSILLDRAACPRSLRRELWQLNRNGRTGRRCITGQTTVYDVVGSVTHPGKVRRRNEDLAWFARIRGCGPSPTAWEATTPVMSPAGPSSKRSTQFTNRTQRPNCWSNAGRRCSRRTRRSKP